MGAMTLATLLLFVGATGKSAQLPLHVWLPDAMEGPTPVSALIHAATMVTAGVYMIGRNAVLFSHAPMTLEIVAGVGVATALMAGTIGLVQNDIKRVLAYSTVSQLGYMFLAMGVGAYAAGIFHLYTHAFFKALLFLGSGAVIHALARRAGLAQHGRPEEVPARHLLDVPHRRAGDCRCAAAVRVLFERRDPVQDVRRHRARSRQRVAVGHRRDHVAPDRDLHVPPRVPDVPWRTPHRRAWRMAHPGQAHDEAHAAHGHGAGHGHGAPHDAPPSMAIPLIVLAIGSVAAGWVGIPHALGGSNLIEGFLEPAFEVHQTAASGEAPAVSVTEPGAAALATEGAAEHAPGDVRTEQMLMAISTGIAVAGIGIAMFFWLGARRLRPHWSASSAVCTGCC